VTNIYRTNFRQMSPGGNNTGSTLRTMPPNSLCEMDQVKELLELIAAHKETGVTGASVMLSFFKRRVQPIQQRHTLGFEYLGTEDPSRMCVEELGDEAALVCVRQILLDVDAVLYVPAGFTAQNRPPAVSVRLLDFFL
jgi:hypothetical protein